MTMLMTARWSSTHVLLKENQEIAIDMSAITMLNNDSALKIDIHRGRDEDLITEADA